MARRVYTPRSRPNDGANIRVGNCEIEDHVDRPIGSGLLGKFSVDACGAVAARRGSFAGPGQSARAAVYGRDPIAAVNPAPQLLPLSLPFLLGEH